MADQGASQARTGKIPFEEGISLRNTTVEPTTLSQRPAGMSGTMETGKGAGENAKKLSEAFEATSLRDGLVQSVTYRRFLGWDGSTPVRWTSTDFTPPQDGLTNITVEGETVVVGTPARVG